MAIEAGDSIYAVCKYFVIITRSLLSFRHCKNVDDAFTLGKWQDAKKRLQREANVCKELDNEIKLISDPGARAPAAPSGQRFVIEVSHGRSNDLYVALVSSCMIKGLRGGRSTIQHALHVSMQHIRSHAPTSCILELTS